MLFTWGNYYSASLKFCRFVKKNSRLNQCQMVNDWTNHCPLMRKMWELLVTKTGSYCKHVNNSSDIMDNAVSAVLSKLDNIASRRAENSTLEGFSLLPTGTVRCLGKHPVHRWAMTHIECLLLHQLEALHCHQVATLAVKNSEWPAINCDGQKVRLVTFQVF